jgi:hypothetical protein
MRNLNKEISIFIAAFILTYLSYKIDCVNAMIIYLLVRLWFYQEWGNLDE